MLHSRFSLSLLALLAAPLLLGGCTLSNARIARAEAVVAAATDRSTSCTRPDHCALPSPLLDQARAALAASTAEAPVHEVTLLDDSERALAARIHLVRAARVSIDVQTFIWSEDDAGLLMLDELVHAARRGVRVRILADQLFSFNDPALLERLALASPALEIKLYNPTFHKARTPPLEFAAGIVCCFARFNQRMHNKLLLVDADIGITGGRNYEDRYFNWSSTFDYVDRDVMVAGPAARSMAESFERFWEHPRSLALTHLRDVNRLLLDAARPAPWHEQAWRHPERVARIRALATHPQWVATHLLASQLRVGQVAYFSDLPGKAEDGADAAERRRAAAFTRHIMAMVASTRREVVLQTPYLVMSRDARHIFRALHRREAPPRVIVSTNSLASTDAFAVYALSYKHRKRYLKKFGFEIHEMKPDAPLAAEAWLAANIGDTVADAAPAAEPKPSAFGRHGSGNRPVPLLRPGQRFGLHAKSIVVDDTLAMIGSHNFDPRSDHYNTESGVIVYDKPFADRLRASMLGLTRPENAWTIAPRQPRIPWLTDLNQAIGDLSSQLPLFDLWPFRYATSYQLKPGCAPLRIDDPNFRDCYEPVGDFPDVAISPKLFYTRLITAFGSGAHGIL